MLRGFYFVLLMMLGMDFASLGSYMLRVLIPMFITGLSPGIDGIGHISGLIVGMACGFLFFWFIV